MKNGKTLFGRLEKLLPQLIEKSEIKALEEAAQEFEDSFINFIQCYRRLILLIKPFTTETPKKEILKNAENEYRKNEKEIIKVGDACPNCHNFTLVRTGTCMTCQSCGFNTGCA